MKQFCIGHLCMVHFFISWEVIQNYQQKSNKRGIFDTFRLKNYIGWFLNLLDWHAFHATIMLSPFQKNSMSTWPYGSRRRSVWSPKNHDCDAFGFEKPHDLYFGAVKSSLKEGQIDFAKPSRHTPTRETGHNFWSWWRKHTSSLCSVCFFLFFLAAFLGIFMCPAYTLSTRAFFFVRTLAYGQRLSEKQKTKKSALMSRAHARHG